LRGELRKAKTYDEWKATAKRMDAELEFDEWKEVEDDGYYDSPLVKRVKRTLTRLRGAKDTRGLMDALSVCLRTNFAGTESVKMYSEVSTPRFRRSTLGWEVKGPERVIAR
jgi:hypothetical protein